MGKVVERLEFMGKMNQRLRKESFDQLFEDEEFTSKFVDFVSSAQGKKWLTKPQGRLFIWWQERCDAESNSKI
jgi:hypothetical protein